LSSASYVGHHIAVRIYRLLNETSLWGKKGKSWSFNKKIPGEQCICDSGVSPEVLKGTPPILEHGGKKPTGEKLTSGVKERKAHPVLRGP